MVQALQRTAVSGPTLIRLLARLTDADVTESRQSPSDRLSQWLDWTHAIALSTALNGDPPTVAPNTRSSDRTEDADCARLRASLAYAITGESNAGAGVDKGNRRPPADVATDYPAFRQQIVSLQQLMETDIGVLRGRLRGILAARAPGMARLAMVDAVMEQALSARERSLLGAIPALLGGHFERLRLAAQQTPEMDGDASATPSRDWLVTFRKDMQSVLLAELEIRFQPVEGLLAALRTR